MFKVLDSSGALTGFPRPHQSIHLFLPPPPLISPSHKGEWGSCTFVPRVLLFLPSFLYYHFSFFFVCGCYCSSCQNSPSLQGNDWCRSFPLSLSPSLHSTPLTRVFLCLPLPPPPPPCCRLEPPLSVMTALKKCFFLLLLLFCHFLSKSAACIVTVAFFLPLYAPKFPALHKSREKSFVSGKREKKEKRVLKSTTGRRW